MDIYQEITKFYTQVKTEKRIIGKSVFGRNLYAIKLGTGAPVGIAQYAIHGREYITAKLALSHLQNEKIKGSVWVLPLMNPDGALLSQVGLSSVKPKRKKGLLLLNGDRDFSLWKANGRGVDLNVNFDAKWGKGAKNTKILGAENCIGKKPFSEPESLALKKFTLKIRPDYTVSYHTKGEEIYWYFDQSTRTCPRDLRLATVLSGTTGYPLAQAKGSVGGYKDWCIQRLQIPAFTIEAGADSFSHPLDGDALTDILLRNQSVLATLSQAVWEM